MAEAATQEQPKKGGKKIIVFALVGVLLAAGGGGAAWFFLKGKPHAEEAHEEAKPAATAKAPSYLPLDTMVVNLADPGGERFAQLGITIELSEEKAADKIRSFLPSVRSSILLLVSQRTSEDLLTRNGKEKLAADIAVEVARPLGFAEEMETYAKALAKAAATPASGVAPAEPPKRPVAREGGNPVRGVLFSSFIIQ